MDNKKTVKKNNSKSTKKKTVKKTTTNNTTSKKKATKKKSKGFTLIELLAVIIILGVLMIIAIPSVTTYISNSRKSSYVDTVKELVGSARNLVNSGKNNLYDKDAAYYIPVKCLPTENGARTPYGEFTVAYVVVTYNGDGYSYYFTGTDSSHTGIKSIVAFNDLDVDNIATEVEDTDIDLDEGIPGHGKIVEISSSDCKSVEERTSNANKVVQVINSSTPGEIHIGDEVVIGTEHFYVVSTDTNETVLLAKYNLHIGRILGYDDGWISSDEIASSSEGYGIQNSNALGWYSGKNPRYYHGVIKYSSSAYWAGGSYSGDYDAGTSTPYPYVYDSNSTLYPYIQSYVSKLKEMGAPSTITGRLPNYEEISYLKSSRYFFYSETSYWLGSAYSDSSIWYAWQWGDIQYLGYSDDTRAGLRPVIEIKTKDIKK